MIKNLIIKWAIKQIVKDGSGTYAQMRYLEDVVENQFGEAQYIFAHRLVRPNPKKRNRPSNDERFAAMRSPEAISSDQGLGGDK